jgi:hypothetical protein
MKELVTMLRRAAMVFGLVGILAVGYRVVLSEQEGSLTESPDAVLSPREMVPTAADLDEIVVTSDNVPEGWVIQATRPGRVALDYLIRYGQVRHATTGFVDARATTFCAEGEGCGTSWIAQYRSEGDAEAAVSVFRSEMVVGWGMGAHSEPLGFGQDQGYVFMNNLGNAAANQAYLWRTGNLVLGMLAIGDMEIAPLRLLAEQMNTRSR